MLSFRERMQQKMVGEFKKFRHVPSNYEFTNLEEDYESPLGRRYRTPTGNLYPSITTVLSITQKDHIAKWRAKVGEEKATEVSNRATLRGTRVHSICENYINGDVDKLTNLGYDDLSTFRSLKPIIDQYIDDIVVQEVALFSDKLKVAGRTDCIANYGGVLSVIDFKTSTKQKKVEWIGNYFAQGAAYAVMFEEMTGRPIEQIVILIACDIGEPQVFIVKRDDHIDNFVSIRKQFESLYNV